jgi:hypothetical protein
VYLYKLVFEIIGFVFKHRIYAVIETGYYVPIQIFSEIHKLFKFVNINKLKLPQVR